MESSSFLVNGETKQHRSRHQLSEKNVLITPKKVGPRYQSNRSKAIEEAEKEAAATRIDVNSLRAWSTVYLTLLEASTISSPSRMSLEDVVKGVGEIYARLFDHHPFVSGEINFFLKEFEANRSDREVEQLFQILEHVTEIRENSLDKAITLSDKHLCNLAVNFDVSLGMCSKILESEALDKTNYLEEQRKKREAEWVSFTKDIADKQSRVDTTFEQKEHELRSYYVDLEEKLHINA